MKKVLLLVIFVLTLSIGMNPVTSSAAIADGTHNITYQVNKPNSKSASMANDYFIKPAKLIVSNGTMKLQMTIKNSSWVTEFKPPGGATIISTNPTADQRVVQFNVANLNPLEVAMKIDIDEIDYHHAYKVDFVFNSEGLPEQKVKENPPSSKPDEKTSNAATSQNTSETKKPNSSAQSSEKQSVQNQQGNQTSQGAQNDSSNESKSNENDGNTETQDSNTQSTDSIEPNPETSDEFPYYALILALTSILIIVYNKKLYIRKP